MIPGELLERPQWVWWRLETRQTPKGPRETKVPYDPKLGPRGSSWKRASSTDPSTWGTYQQAIVACRPALNRVGFVFSPDDPYVGVDMDNCVSANGAIHPAAHEVTKALGGYCEFSPSGTGLHVITRARLLRGRHTLKTPWGDEFAVYDRGRFFTMLGNGRGEIRDSQEALDGLIARFFPEPVKVPVARSQPVSGDDVALIDRMLQDHRVAALWAGDVGEFGDHSAADLALCAHLAFFTGNDASRMDSLFRRSGLMRDKWDQPRGTGTYGSVTIERALRG